MCLLHSHSVHFFSEENKTMTCNTITSTDKVSSSIIDNMITFNGMNICIKL